jgi:hypothetical protein
MSLQLINNPHHTSYTKTSGSDPKSPKGIKFGFGSRFRKIESHISPDRCLCYSWVVSHGVSQNSASLYGFL